MNKANIILLPKIPSPSNMSNFCPISLCSAKYKIIVRLMANRFRVVLDKCIDEAQYAFVPNRLITDNVFVAYELLHTLINKRSGRKSFMGLKLDMSKAYDRVEWDFLQAMMVRMGFDKQ